MKNKWKDDHSLDIDEISSIYHPIVFFIPSYIYRAPMATISGLFLIWVDAHNIQYRFLPNALFIGAKLGLITAPAQVAYLKQTP